MSDAEDQYCAFCGLPLAGTSSRRPASASQTDYCCSGCRVAAAVENAPAAEHAQRRLLLRIGLAVFFTMNVVVFTMELWTRDVYGAASFGSPLEVRLRQLFQWASLAFSMPVLLLLCGPIAAGVWESLRRRAITTDLLILLGVVAAYAYSIVSVFRGEGQVYFEVGCVVLVFVSIGRWLEARGKYDVGAALDGLARLLPENARRATSLDSRPGSHTAAEMVPRGELRVGDLVRVLPGERLTVDGTIIAGRATIDEQIVTGESRTTVKSVGDSLYSGTLNVDGDLWIETTAAAGRDMISRMLVLVREARRAKGRHERLADRVAAWFVPFVCVIALAAAWRHGSVEGIDRGILAGLAVVLIACPCALGLATPMAVWTALGRAADEQVLFRSGVVLERLAGVGAVCFDKTGTLTSGAAMVRELIVPLGESRSAVLLRAGRLAGGSTHGLSQAVSRFAGSQGQEPVGVNGCDPETIETHPGRGVCAVGPTGAATAYLGSPRWMAELRQGMADELTDALAKSDFRDAPMACVAWDGAVRGVILFSEQLRSDAAPAIAACRDLGLDVELLTGDRRVRAATIAAELGVTVAAEQLPAEKAAAVQRRGRRVAMVGDGLNDAPALAAAEVGVALGCGADLTRDAAGVCLLSDRLDRLPWAIGLARQTVRTIRQNLFWAFAYNVAGIVLAACGRLNPIWAAAAMGLSSLLVIGNSLRLGRYGRSTAPVSIPSNAPPGESPIGKTSSPAAAAALLVGAVELVGACP